MIWTARVVAVLCVWCFCLWSFATAASERDRTRTVDAEPPTPLGAISLDAFDTLPPEMVEPGPGLSYVVDAGLTARFVLNDVVLARSQDPQGGHGWTGSVRDWIMPGVNTLAVEIRPDPDARDAGREACLAARLLTPSEGDRPREDTTTLGLRWCLPQGAPADPVTLRRTFVVSGPLPSILWGEAVPMVALSTRDKQSLLALARQVVRAINAGDKQSLRRLFAYRVAEQGRLYDLDSAATERRLDDMVALAGVVTVTLPDSGVRTRLVAHKRVVSLEGRDGAPAITGGDDSALAIALYLARIGGSWIIVR